MAKFKVGQQVYVKGDDTPRTIEWYDPKKGYAISGEAIYYPEEDIVAANKKKAKNAKFKVGDIVIDKSFPHSGRFRIIRVDSDEQYSIQPLRGGAITGEWEENLVRVRANSVAANAKFKVGDKVYFYGRPATVKQVIREPDADYILDVQGDEFYAEDEEVTSRNSVACNSRNPVVAKAINACRNATACNGSVVLYTDSGDTKRVYEGGKVTFDGKPYTAKALGSPQMDKATLVDDSGNEVVVRLKDTRLKAANAKPAARNAKGVEAWDKLIGRITRAKYDLFELIDMMEDVAGGIEDPAKRDAKVKYAKDVIRAYDAFRKVLERA